MKLSDEKLYQLCKKYGQETLHWRWKFVGLLPEVNKRRLFEKKGFSSVFEFAAKLAGLSQDQVSLALNLERRFEDKPALKELLIEGKVSLNKLTRVVSIATVDNEKELAEKVKKLSNDALETLVRDERYLAQKKLGFENRNGSTKPLFGDKCLHVQTLNFALSSELAEQLNELHAQGKNVNELLLNLLRQRKEKFEEEKERLSQEAEPTDSKYLPVLTRKLLEEEYGKKCSIKWCLRPATEIHHSQRFSLAHTHDPKYLAPLCHEHHQIAHAIDRKVQEHRRAPP